MFTDMMLLVHKLTSRFMDRAIETIRYKITKNMPDKNSEFHVITASDTMLIAN